VTTLAMLVTVIWRTCGLFGLQPKYKNRLVRCVLIMANEMSPVNYYMGHIIIHQASCFHAPYRGPGVTLVY
jgi:hypothetical protein